ncbi:hypothetical protein NPX13_g6880 [Xylaria arbuscula]|uniref:Copper-fist domain-containing protein n=1 Tax=Xylaria arbuscula TaxID=114810 RepID=A0A9W8NB14_9PEZI|nr:hypothetical protein NPX13_g6880 [Xylaria arbuscula]
MLINGEKWACEACVRGHRVSNCQHSGERLLPLFINSNYPPSLAPRLMLQITAQHPEQYAFASLLGVLCRRRRTNTSKSEPLLSFDENGHHKPTHKHTRPSHNCGPYTINRGATIHGTGTGTGSVTRSVDNLVHYGKTGGRSRTTTTSSSDLEARMIKSEQTSPLMGGNSSFHQLNGQLPPLDLSSIHYPEYNPAFDLFGSSGLSDHEAPMFSAGLSAVSVDWAQYDGLEVNGGDSLASSSFDPMHAYAGFDLASSVEPTLTSIPATFRGRDFASAFNDGPLDSFHGGAPGSYMSMPDNVVTSNDLSNLDFDQFKGTAAASKFMSIPTPLEDAGYLEEDNYWGMSNFNDGISHSPDPITTALWDSNV